MLTEILSVVFLVGVPIWLVVEEVLHRSRIRVKAGRALEICKSAHERLAANRHARAA